MLRRNLPKSMLRRTSSQQSFSVSHKALCYRANKPLLAAGMNSHERAIAAWDDLPWQLHVATHRNTFYAEQTKAVYEYGLRLDQHMTRTKMINLWLMFFIIPAWFWSMLYPLLYLVIFETLPSEMVGAKGKANTLKYYGLEVWCADGKFVIPWTHINPPMFTMRVEDLK